MSCLSKSERSAAAVWIAVSLAGSSPLCGCVEIDGGAVEVPWAIFSPDGRAISDCSCAVTAATATPADTSIAFVQLDLDWDSPDGSPCTDPAACAPCADRSACRFACGRKIGATPFMIPAGQYLMSLTPLDAAGDVLAIQSTAPVLRQVRRGQPTELDAFVLTASCATRCNGAVTDQPCTGG